MDTSVDHPPDTYCLRCNAGINFAPYGLCLYKLCGKCWSMFTGGLPTSKQSVELMLYLKLITYFEDEPPQDTELSIKLIEDWVSDHHV